MIGIKHQVKSMGSKKTRRAEMGFELLTSVITQSKD